MADISECLQMVPFLPTEVLEILAVIFMATSLLLFLSSLPFK